MYINSYHKLNSTLYNAYVENARKSTKSAAQEVNMLKSQSSTSAAVVDNSDVRVSIDGMDEW